MFPWDLKFINFTKFQCQWGCLHICTVKLIFLEGGKKVYVSKTHLVSTNQDRLLCKDTRPEWKFITLFQFNPIWIHFVTVLINSFALVTFYLRWVESQININPWGRKKKKVKRTFPWQIMNSDSKDYSFPFSKYLLK